MMSFYGRQQHTIRTPPVRTVTSTGWPFYGNLAASPAIIGNSRAQSLISEHRCTFRSQRGAPLVGIDPVSVLHRIAPRLPDL
jgi:hypothetical protein